MRRPIHSALLVVAGLALTAPAEAGTRWFGAQLHFPVPAQDVGNTQLGVDAGVTYTHMKNSHVGYGADVIYHHWPASDDYVAAFDRYLRSTRFEALDGTNWAYTAFQATGHFKLTIPAGERLFPWIQAGVGAYLLDRNLDEQKSADTYAEVIGPGGNLTIVPGGYCGVGFDFHVTPAVALGLDATFHYVRSRDESLEGANDLPDFSAFTIGTHVLFGWE